jgi:hypothetical protein
MKSVQLGSPRVRACMIRYLGRGLLLGLAVGCGMITAATVLAALFELELFSVQAESVHRLMLGSFVGSLIAGLLIGLFVGLGCAYGGRDSDR